MALMLGAALLPSAKVGAVPATSLAPNFTEQNVTSSDDCTVVVKHGNFGSAVSQMVHAPGMLTCRSDAYVENISWNTTTHAYAVQRCYISSQVGDIGSGSCSRTTSNGYAVYQATSISGNALIGTKLCLRGDNINCEDFEFGFSGTLANPTQNSAPVTLSDSGCSVEFAHGYYGTAAVSRIANASGCNLNNTYVEMTVVDTTDASVDTQRCYLNTGTTGQCSFYASGEQATILTSYLLSSTVRVCPTSPATCVTTPQFKPGL